MSHYRHPTHGAALAVIARMDVASGGMAGDDSRMAMVLTREIRESDVATVVRMVHDLAAYEKSSDECRMTVEQLRGALFCAAPALFGHVAEVDERVVGFVLWFLNFSTWTGTHGVYGEDMYVEPEHRGQGVGRALFEAMARVCVERGYQRLEFWTLDWNTGTIAFTTSLGAKPMDEWTVYRISGAELTELGGARAG